MAFYEEMRDVASEVLAEFKQGAVHYVHVTPGTGPIDDPGPSSYTLTLIDSAVRGVRSKYVQDGLAVASDLQAIMSARHGIVPDIKDFIDVDGKRHKIVHISAKPEAGTAVAYLLIIRK